VEGQLVTTDVAGPDPHNGPSSDSFGDRLRWWRRQHQWSQRELGAATFFSREYVALIERGERRPSADFVQRADAALGAGGTLRASFATERAAAETAWRPRARRQPSPVTAKAAGRLRRTLSSLPNADGGTLSAAQPALNDLVRALEADLEADDVRHAVDQLQQQHAGLVARSGQNLKREEVVCAAALAVGECIALLQRPVIGDARQQLTALAARFAAQAADGLVVLGMLLDAQRWYGVAARIGSETSERDRSEVNAVADVSAIEAPGRAPGHALPSTVPARPRWIVRCRRGVQQHHRSTYPRRLAVAGRRPPSAGVAASRAKPSSTSPPAPTHPKPSSERSSPR
jgi:transcriptional regulator with XRE-family HTH domain